MSCSAGGKGGGGGTGGIEGPLITTKGKKKNLWLLVVLEHLVPLVKDKKPSLPGLNPPSLLDQVPRLEVGVVTLEKGKERERKKKSVMNREKKERKLRRKLRKNQVPSRKWQASPPLLRSPWCAGTGGERRLGCQG